MSGYLKKLEEGGGRMREADREGWEGLQGELRNLWG